MNRTPRASLTITLLSDEDYRTLARSKGGMEAFGVFVAIVVLGRAALQDGRAERLPDSEALRFESRTAHVVDLVGVTAAQLQRTLAAFAMVAKETGRKPWLYLDKGDRLVIRSFFKFNTKEGWGGPREGSGRKSNGAPNGNQDDSKMPPAAPLEKNQLDSNLEPSWGHSGTGPSPGLGSGTGTGSVSGTAAEPVETDGDIPAGEQQIPPTADPSGRNTADAADVQRAIDVLCSDLRTDPLGMRLGREHNGKQMLSIHGWQWLIGAERMQGESVPEGKRDSWPYYVAVARNVKESERTERERKAPISALSPPRPRPVSEVVDPEALRLTRERTNALLRKKTHE